MLEVFLKRYSWTANLVVLFAAAWLTAKTVNTAIGAAIRPTPQIDVASLPTSGAASLPVPSLDAEKLYPLFGIQPPQTPVAGEAAGPQAPPAPRTCRDIRAPPVSTSLHAQLVGAIVADDPRWSTAVVVDTSSRETHTYAIGESVLGSPLLSVERIRDDRDSTGRGFRVVAIVCNDGQKQYIDFDSGGPNVGVAAAPPPPFAAPAKPVTDPDGIRKLADNRYEVKKSVIDGTLSNLNNIATQARIVPSFKNGVANGFKLFSVQPDSFYTQIGVENGDVIQKINGYEINSPDKALEVYQKLRDSQHITMDIERNGQTIRKEYNISGP